MRIKLKQREWYSNVRLLIINARITFSLIIFRILTLYIQLFTCSRDIKKSIKYQNIILPFPFKVWVYKFAFRKPFLHAECIAFFGYENEYGILNTEFKRSANMNIVMAKIIFKTSFWNCFISNSSILSALRVLR